MHLIAAMTSGDETTIRILQNQFPADVKVTPYLVSEDMNILGVASDLKQLNPDLVIILNRAVIDRGLTSLLDHHRITYLGPSNIDCEILDEYNDSISQELKAEANLTSWFMVRNSKLVTIGCALQTTDKILSLPSSEGETSEVLGITRRASGRIVEKLTQNKNLNGMLEMKGVFKTNEFQPTHFNLVPDYSELCKFGESINTNVLAPLWQSSWKSESLHRTHYKSIRPQG